MATSDSTDLTYTANDIITDALELIGVIAPGETPPAHTTSRALRALNMICKQWTGGPNPLMPGMKMWLRDTASLTLTTKAVYTLKPSGGDLDIPIPVDILVAKLQDSNYNDYLLEYMTREEYEAIGNKTDTGDPTRYHYERQSPNQGYLYLNCVPSDTSKTIKLVYHTEIEDLDNLTNDVDFPEEYYRALKFQLAIDSAPIYGRVVDQTLSTLATQAIAFCQYFDPENVVSYFQPGKD